MKLRMAAACIAAGTLVAVSSPASAATSGEGKVMGLRLEASLEQDFNLVGPGGLSAGGATLGAPSPHGDIRIGYDLPMGLTPMLGVGFRSFSTTVVTTPPGDGDEVTQEFSGTAITLALELRFYLKKHKKGLQPFVFGEYNTSFLSATVADDTEGADDAVDAANEGLEYDADANNHGEINLGLGAEYKFSRAFGIGGKWGLGIGLTGGDRNEPLGGDDQTAIRTDATTIGTSAAVYAAWRL